MAKICCFFLAKSQKCRQKTRPPPFNFFGGFGGGEKEGSVRAGGGGRFFHCRGEGVSQEEGGRVSQEEVARRGGQIFFFGAEMPTKS